jgi:chemosensory pili system protein ChpA (sensor histidine kinase/response regulator)
MTTGAASLLSWVKTEIDFSLKVVRETLEKVESDPAEAKGLHVCPHQLHQVSGALRMVGLEGARQFCSAIEGVLDGVSKSAPAGKTLNVAGRAIGALQEFTDNVANGGANVPLKLFPIYRELAAQLGRTDTSEKELFFPDLGIAPPDHPDRQTLAPDALREYAVKQRTRFQRGLVAWIHKPDDPRGLREMGQAVDGLDRISSQLPEPRSLWWISGALIDGLLQPPSPQWLATARTVCSKIDFQMRDLAKSPARLNDQLVRDLLYIVAACPPSTERLKGVKESYSLDTLLPEPEVGLEFDMDWLQPALADMRSRLETAKNTWVEYLGGESQRLMRFRELAKALKARADELGNHQLVRLFDVVVLVSTRLPEPYPSGSQFVMLEMATAFLLAESVIDTFTAPPVDLEQQVVLVNGWLLDAASGKANATPPAGLRNDLVQQFNQAQLRAQVAKEIISNLQQIEEVLDAYSRDQAKRDALPGLRPSLRQIHGALMVLGFTQSTELLKRCEEMIDDCASREDAPPAEVMDWIAEGLSSLGLFLEPCLRGRGPEMRAVESYLTRFAQRPRPAPVAAENEETTATDAEPAVQSSVETAHEVAPEIAFDITVQSLNAPESTSAVESERASAAEPSATEPSAAPASEVNEEMLDVYLEEAEEVLANIGDAMPACRQRADDRDALTIIRRGFHTLKGSGRMVGLTDLGEIAWAVEQVMNRWLELRLPATPALLQLIDDARVSFGGWVQQLKAREQLTIDAERILEVAARLKSGEDVAVTVSESATAPVDTATAGDLPAIIAPPEIEVEAPLPAPVEESIATSATPVAHAEQPSTELELPALDFALGAVPSVAVEPAPALVPIDTPAAPALPPEGQLAAEPEITVGNIRVPAALYEIYLKEAQQHAATLNLLVEQWCEQPGREAPASCGRAAHTLAGISRTAGFESMAELAAAMEQWIPHARHTSLPADVATVKSAVGTLNAMVRDLEQRTEPPAANDLARALHDITARTMVPAMAVEAPAAPAPGPAEKRAINDDIDAQLLPLFLEEAMELLPLIGGDLRDWKVRPTDANIPLSLKRTLHTLKGSARMAGAMRLGELAHVMESSIEAADGSAQPAPELIAELESQMDRLSFGIDALSGAPHVAPPPLTTDAPAAPYVLPQAPAPNVVTQPAAPTRTERQAAATSAAMLRISADTLDRLINDAGESSIARSRIEGEVRGIKGSIGELSDSVVRLRNQLREMELQADSQLQSRASAPEAAREDFDPLEFDRYTRLQELARMMGETMHDIMSIHQTLVRTVDEADAALLHQGRINRDLQQQLMTLRTVPFSSMTERLHRVVRQAAREAEKSAELEIRGEQVQLDRSVLERIAAPLEHLLRNAVAHGIERPADRTARSKPQTGSITLTLRPENDAVVLVLQDDGGGLDLEKLRQRGVERGLLAADSQPSAAEVAQLVFASGVSTADTITALAGRGVGMDVVRNEITATGGRIEIDTSTGIGTTFTVFLPLTLAVAQAVLVRTGDQVYALSSASVVQVLRVKPAELAAMYDHRGVEAHGQRYALHYLGHLLGTAERPPVSEGYSTVLLLRSGTQRTAVHVDELLRNQEIVIKNIGPQLARTTWIAGATVLGDGRIVLIINAVQLAQRAEAATQASPMIAPVMAAAAPRTVMVVDDSLTVRKITSRLLEREGYRVLAAKDGVDALEQVHRSLPDIMLVDIEMPRMDGFDLTRNLRGDPRTASVPIIVISSRTADKHRTHAFELGVNDFIGKPYQEAELLAHIQKYLEPQTA